MLNYFCRGKVVWHCSTKTWSHGLAPHVSTACRYFHPPLRPDQKDVNLDRNEIVCEDVGESGTLATTSQGPCWEATTCCPSSVIRFVCCNELLHLLPVSTEISTWNKNYYKIKAWCSWSPGHDRHIRKRQSNRKQNARYWSWSSQGLYSNIPIQSHIHVCTYIIASTYCKPVMNSIWNEESFKIHPEWFPCTSGRPDNDLMFWIHSTTPWQGPPKKTRIQSFNDLS